MLKQYKRGLIITAMLGMAVGVPVYSQSINTGSLIGMQQNAGITLSINDISAEAAINLVCEHFGYAPMFHMPLTHSISVELNNASLDQAMEKILANTSTDYMLENGRLHVFKPRESWSRFSEKNIKPEGEKPQQNVVLPPAEPTITKIVPLGKRTAADIQKLVKELNPRISVVHDVPTNAVIIMGPESLVNGAELLCKNIDAMEVKQTATDTSKLIKGLRYITQTFELEHADFEEVEKELSNIIERDQNSSSGSSSSASNLRDKDGNPIETEYFLLDKPRRVAVVHTTIEKFAVIEAYFKAIDKPLPQVLIEASIVAVDDGLDKQLGIKWNGFDTESGQTGYYAPTAAASVNESFKDFLKIGGTLNTSNVKALLRAVETDDKSEILSRPRVITVTGKTSSIHVGDEIPYTSGSSVTDGGTTTSSVDFKEVGIKLDVTPIVNLKDNTIQLNVIPEVSQWVKDVVMGDNTVPQVSTRRAESTIKIKNGETMVIGGLIETKIINGVYEVPLLSKIPFIGRAFKNKTTNNTKTNLIILITAHIVDENHKNIVTSKAVKEINEIKPLRYSETIEEISEPTVDGPNVYGENIEWPKQEEVKEEIAPVTNEDRGWQHRDWMPKTPTKKVKKTIKQEEKAPETQPQETADNKNVEDYLQHKLKEIRENLRK